ncbi:enoyl-CoA hydratase/carnithine racemase [Clostridium beijerinckii]|nr:enoyl-CoA hydratase/carnithine racemase [Clostridium beijerinckii]
MELKNVILEKEGHLAIVTINRPKALNALNSETLKDLDAVFRRFRKRQQYVYSYRYWCW